MMMQDRYVALDGSSFYLAKNANSRSLQDLCFFSLW